MYALALIVICALLLSFYIVFIGFLGFMFSLGVLLIAYEVIKDFLKPLPTQPEEQ